MKRPILTLVVCSLMLAVWPAGTSAHEDDAATTISNSGPVPTDHGTACGPQVAIGLGPPLGDVPGCPPTTHKLGAPGFMLIGFSSGSGSVGPVLLTGSLTVNVTSASGNEVLFTCSWNAGGWTGCRIDSLTGWPGIGETFEFWCYSSIGTIGNWDGCKLTHT